MPNGNLGLLQDGYAAFAGADLARLGELFADDILWHVPGRNPLFGDYRGKEQVFALFGKLAEQTGGTFHAEVHDLLANDTHGVGLVTVTATREDRSLTVNQVNVLHLHDGKVTEGWIASTDQQAEDEFWGLTERPSIRTVHICAHANYLAEVSRRRREEAGEVLHRRGEATLGASGRANPM